MSVVLIMHELYACRTLTTSSITDIACLIAIVAYTV